MPTLFMCGKFQEAGKPLRRTVSPIHPGKLVAQRFLHIAGRPTTLACAGLILSLIYLFWQLGSATPAALGPWISSDTLWPANVFTDLFRDHYSLAGWAFSIAPCWFPDVLLVGLFLAATHNVILATLFAGFVQIGFLVGAFQLCRRAIGIRAGPVQDPVLLATSAAVALYVAARPGRLYPDLYRFFLPQTHVGSLLSMLYALGLALLLIRRSRESRSLGMLLPATYTALCLLAGMSNLSFFVHMLLPLTVSVLFVLCFGMIKVRDCWAPVVIGWPAAALGAVLNRTMFHTAGLSLESGVTVDRIATAADVFLRGALGKCLQGDLLHLLAIAWILVCLGYILYTVRALIRRSTDQVAFAQVMACLFFSFCLLSSILSLAAPVVGGSNGLVTFKDYLWTMHYMQPAFLVPIFGLPMVFSWGIFLSGRDRIWRPGTAALAIFAVLAPGYAIAKMQAPVSSIEAYEPPLVQFMDSLATHVRLKYGYAGYWQARIITLLSRRGLRAYQVDAMLNPFLWVNNRQWYSARLEDRTKRPQIDFVVLDDPLWKIPRESAVEWLGEPAREVRFENTRILIYSKDPPQAPPRLR